MQPSGRAGDAAFTKARGAALMSVRRESIVYPMIADVAQK
jgi:hypothetical protein